jgi:pimeloyl-ACP methyl ester carboxylesterase
MKMDKANVNGTEIAYEVQGDGEAVLLMHCGFVADAMKPLMKEPTVRNFRLINYHRRGYGESAPVAPPFEVSQQAEDVVALLDTLGVERAHLVAHSFGANISLQVALDAPERVSSLALLEPPLPYAMDAASIEMFTQTMGAAVMQFMKGDTAGAVDTWLTAAFGPGFQEIVERAIPGATAQMVKDANAAIGIEAPSLQTWTVMPNDIARITCPVLSVIHVDPYFGGFNQVHEGLMQWLTQCEALVIPNTTHLLQIAQPRAVAEGVAGFLQRHPQMTMA